MSNNNKKIKTGLSNAKMHIESIVDGEDQHIIITEKGSKDHAHLIIDGGTGELRVDPKDKQPHDLIKSVQAKLTLKNGDVVQITKSTLSFEEPIGPQPDLRAYSSDKDGYFVLEIYNCGEEDLEEFNVKIDWRQQDGSLNSRILEGFNDENDYLVMVHPKKLNMLKIGSRVYAMNIPMTTYDKKIIVNISCMGMKSGKTIQKTYEFETPNKLP